MAGHSKWANIKHRKAKEDAKRGKIFTKLIREITVAARMGGGGDPSMNPRLRDAIAKARNSNMSNDTIDRAIKRGVGGAEGNDIEEVRYEGYGPGGVAVMVDCMTDNRNRTVSEVRHMFTKHGGNLGTDGSVAYLFTEQGQITFEPGQDENKLMELSVEAGADDVITYEDGSIDIVTSPEQFESVTTILSKHGLKPAQAELNMVASVQVPLDKETSEKLIKMIDALEDLDDVQTVYHNAEINEEALDAL